METESVGPGMGTAWKCAWWFALCPLSGSLMSGKSLRQGLPASLVRSRSRSLRALFGVYISSHVITAYLTPTKSIILRSLPNTRGHTGCVRLIERGTSITVLYGLPKSDFPVSAFRCKSESPSSPARNVIPWYSPGTMLDFVHFKCS